MFFPGETITHIFYVPFVADEIEYVVLTYKQNGEIMFEKTVTSGFEADSSNSTKVSLPFSQNESLLFSDNAPFTIQCNVHTIGGSRHASYEMRSESGIQYHRDELKYLNVEIVSQPQNYNVKNIGDIATFALTAKNVGKYQWQYQIDNNEWVNIHSSNSSTYEVVSTSELISKYQYRCVVYGYGDDKVISDTVRITHTDRGDE